MFDPSGVSLWGDRYRALTHTAIQVKPLRAIQIPYVDPLLDILSQWACPAGWAPHANIYISLKIEVSCITG